MIADTDAIEVPAETQTALSRDERILLGRMEAIIERGLKTFFEVGNALKEISEGRLYRAEYATFSDYLDQRWGIGRAYAYRLIGAAEVVNNLSPTGDKPESERQVRPLTRLEPEQQRAAWQAAVTNSDGQPTAAQVQQAATAYQYQNSQTPRAAWELQNDMIAWLVLQPAESRLEIALGWQEHRNYAPHWQEMVATLPTPWRSSDLTKAIDGTVALLQKHDGALIRAEATVPPPPAVAASIRELEQHVRAWLQSPDTTTMGHTNPLDHLVDIKERKHGWGVAWNNLKWGLDNDGVVYRSSDLHQAVNNVLDQARQKAAGAFGVENSPGQWEQIQTKAAEFTPIPTAALRDAINNSLHTGPKADAELKTVFFHNSRPHIAVAAIYHPDGREEFECYELVDPAMYPGSTGAGHGLYGGLPVRYASHPARLGNPKKFVYTPDTTEEVETVDPWLHLEEKLAALDDDSRADLTDLLTSTAAGLSGVNPAAAELLAAIVALLRSEVAA